MVDWKPDVARARIAAYQIEAPVFASLAPAAMPNDGMHGALCELRADLRTGAVPHTECHDNIKSLAIVFAAIKSAQTGRRVAVAA